MTLLNQNEKEDLHSAFASISDVKPRWFTGWDQLKLFIYSHTVLRLKSHRNKPVIYRK